MEFHITDEFRKDSGGRIIIANHISKIDFLFIWVILRGNCTVVANKASVDSHKWIKYFLGLFDILYVSDNKNSIKSMIECVNSGKTLVIFPEGTITRNGSLGEIKRGIELLARKTTNKVYPVIIHGLLGSKFSKVNNSDTVDVSLLMKKSIPYSETFLKDISNELQNS